MSTKRHLFATRSEQFIVRLSTILSVLIICILFASVAKVTAFPTQQTQQQTAIQTSATRISNPNSIEPRKGDMVSDTLVQPDNTSRSKGTRQQDAMPETETPPALATAAAALIISGPERAAVNVSYVFTATVSPAQATTPVTYTWQTTDPEQTIVHTDKGLNDSVTVTWNTPGTKGITVTATNISGTIVAQRTVPVAQPISSLDIGGPSHGMINTSYDFLALVGPSSATTPVTYTWQVSDQADATVRVGQLNDTLPLQWSTPGTKTITVRATNMDPHNVSVYGTGEVIRSHTVVIEVAPQSISISGPTTAQVGNSSAFTATVSPDSTTTPLTYTWQFQDGTSVVNTGKLLQDSITMTWSNAGSKTFTVTAENRWQQVATTYAIDVQDISSQSSTVYLPAVMKARPVTVFGVETSPGRIAGNSVLERSKELQPTWLRLKSVHWRDVQPQQGGAYDWTALATFEKEVAAANEAGLTPVAIVHQNPDWATIPYQDPSSGKMVHAACGAVAQEHFAAYAAFMSELVSRYSQPPYNVQYWELGNEPDVDPSIMSTSLHEHFGCWGDKDDPYYGGRHYGNMLKVIVPAMKQADPNATILIGGLLLDTPNTTDPLLGKPELFLHGILEAGAGTSFDIVAFHAYPWYDGTVDSDLNDSKWKDRGGVTLGKIKYIREMLTRYGLANKPLSLNEAALLLWSSSGVQPPDAALPANFLDAQANHLVRQATRAMSAGVHSYIWYTLHKSGWNASGLLNEDYSARPAYTAYVQLIKTIGQIQNTPVQTSDYGNAVEAYRFTIGTEVVDVLWSRDGQAYTVEVPAATLRGAMSRDGATLTPVENGDTRLIVVGAAPVYILR